MSAERGLAEVAQMLVAASEFEHGRISVTWLLGQLVHTLPANAAIVSLKVDGAVVTMSALASRATDVVRAIQDMPGASNVEMIGAITYEGAAVEPGVVNPDARATGLERVTIRFRIAPDPIDLRTALASDPGVKK
jgi:hypothetical protein